MENLNWAKTSPTSSLVRSEAFWCTRRVGPEAAPGDYSETDKRGERVMKREREAEGGTSIVSQCSRVV